MRDDIRTLQNGVHIVVGTPGRANDMISRGALRLDRVGLFVLDEADEMLSRGFKDQIYDVFQYLPERVQVNSISGKLVSQIQFFNETVVSCFSNPFRCLFGHTVEPCARRPPP